MKKKVAFVLAFMAVLVFSVQASDFSVRLSSGDTLFFNIIDAEARHVEVTCPVLMGSSHYMNHRQPTGVVTIPATVEYQGQNYEVTALGEFAFAGCTTLRRVVLPSTVRTIGANAFYGCTGLNGSVVIGENIESIGKSAYYGCSSVTEVQFRAVNCTFMGGSVSTTVFGNCRSLRKVTFDEGVRRIPDFAFCGVDALKDSIVLPQSLEYIGDYAFAYCSALSGMLIVPDNVVSIGECAYHQCHTLRALTLGSSLKHIGGRAFYHCIGLKSVTVKSYIPAEIAITTFSDLSRNVKFSVPCVGKKLYEKDGFWKKHAPFAVHGSCSFSVKGSVDNPASGSVIGSGEFRIGDTVTLVAVCAVGYAFDGWSDGIRENPRRSVVSNNMEVKALMRPSTLTYIIDTVLRVDTVYTEGYKIVHDTVDLVLTANSIDGQKEVWVDAASKRLEWMLPANEEVINVAIYNQMGECLYSGDRNSGSVKMNRFPSGTYIVRIETTLRVLRKRFFINNY